MNWNANTNLKEKWLELGFIDDTVPDEEARQLILVLQEAEKFLTKESTNNSHKLPFRLFPHVVARLHYERNIWVRPPVDGDDFNDLLSVMIGVHRGHGMPDYGTADLEQLMVNESVNAYHSYLMQNPRDSRRRSR